MSLDDLGGCADQFGRGDFLVRGAPQHSDLSAVGIYEKDETWGGVSALRSVPFVGPRERREQIRSDERARQCL